MNDRRRHFHAPPAAAFSALALLALATAAAAGPVGRAGEPPDRHSSDDSFGSLLDEYASPAWKQPGWWWRARKDTPAEQLAYANAEFEAGHLRRACSAYNELVHTWQSSPEAPAAQLGLARAYEARGNKTRAFQEYQYAILRFPNAIPYEETVAAQMALARDMEGELGSGFLGWGASVDAEDLAELYRIVAANAPASDLAPECFFRMGEVLSGEHSRRYDLALDPYETLGARYPASPLVPAAAYGAARARVLLARKYPNDDKRAHAAADSIDFTLRGYGRLLPGEAVADLRAWRAEIASAIARADFGKAAFYDTIRRKPDAAAAAYRRFVELHPDVPEAEAARRRLAELGASAEPTAP